MNKLLLMALACIAISIPAYAEVTSTTNVPNVKTVTERDTTVISWHEVRITNDTEMTQQYRVVYEIYCNPARTQKGMNIQLKPGELFNYRQGLGCVRRELIAGDYYVTAKTTITSPSIATHSSNATGKFIVKNR